MSVHRIDDTAQPRSFSCAQKIVQTGDNSNNYKKNRCIINNLCKVSNKKIWPGAEVNVDAGRQRDAVKAWQSLNSQVGPSSGCGVCRTMYGN